MSTATAEKLLGGQRALGHKIQTDRDRYEVSQNGLPKKVLVHFAANVDLSMRFMAYLLNINERTIQRKKDFDLLDGTTSEQLLAIAEVYARAADVLGSLESCQKWLNTENRALGNEKPIVMLKSRFGAQMILDLLGRMEHGIVS